MPASDFAQSTTRSWQMSLGAEVGANAACLEWLRSEFFKLRDRVGLLVGEIHRDLPDFTRHDLSHCDALWEMADLVGGEELDLNPVEGFVLGAVFLLHDAALSLAALPDRLVELQRDPLWNDTAAAGLKRRFNRQPKPDELAAVDDGRDREMQQWVAANVLRTRHATYAERLVLHPYTNADGEQFYLIEDEELRAHFGRDIGRLAASHGLSLDQVSSDFATLPPLPSVPGRCHAAWQVDRLKVACLIRTCDAIHLDSRRAPGFLRAIRRPAVDSDPHWQFQRRISITRQGDRICFSSGYAFPSSEAIAWWVGYELVQNAERELRQVDALLADLNKHRFAVRGVFGAESPERLSEVIPTDGWEPVEARVRVSNVAEVARRLGGESLYGQDGRGTVPLRELIQNACDAVRARYVLEAAHTYVTHELGEVVVRQGMDEYGHWIEVEDNGVGMSASVLTGPLLDFGASLWDTPQQYHEWPGLSGRGFQPAGRFGIGFFSVFMWGDRVRVTSRRFDQGRDTTRVLEWQKGLDWHPLLRLASADEYINDGGTRVRVWTRKLAEIDYAYSQAWDLKSICTILSPALDVSLWVEMDVEGPTTGMSVSRTRRKIVQANDWMICDGKELLRRVWAEYYDFGHLRSPELLESFAQMLQPLMSDGRVIGRACLFDWRVAFSLFGQSNYRAGCVTVGGLRASELTGIAGVLIGEPERAARDEAMPVVNAEELARWATDQALRFADVISDFNQQVGVAQVVRVCGGLTGPLFITATGCSEGWLQLSHDDIVTMEDFPDEIIFLDFDILQGARLAQSIQLYSNVFLTKFEVPTLLLRPGRIQVFNWTLEDPQRISRVADPDWRTRYRTLFGALIEATATRWGCSIDDVLTASTLKNTAEDPPIEREIGLINGQPISYQVGLLRRPEELGLR